MYLILFKYSKTSSSYQRVVQLFYPNIKKLVWYVLIEWMQGVQILAVYSKQVQAAIKNMNVNTGIDLYLLSL